MSKCQFTPQAVADLFDIWSFMAEDNPAAADWVEEAVFRACVSLLIRLLPDA